MSASGAGGSNVLALLFRLLRSHTDAQMREALSAFVERVKQPDMAPVRDSLDRWVQAVLQDEFRDTNMSLKEEPAMLFNQRFRKYEDLLEYEAIKRGRRAGRREGKLEGRQEGRQEGVRLALQDILQTLASDDRQELPADIVEKISAADVEQLRNWIRLLVGGARPRQVFAGH